MPKRYKWQTPYEWLESACQSWDEKRLRFELLELARKHDSDALQDEYQTEMERDGYFQEEPGRRNEQ